ncbi:MAG: hypothetical protein JNK64_12000 [Myxococcales bacterium]|nr:hypothetical protein [Myxococcales bacterium]
MKSRSLFALAVVATAACGETGTEVSVTRRFDNPVDVAFGCYGAMKRTDTGESVQTPQPLASCRIRAIGSPAFASDAIDVPPGQEGIANSAMFWYTAAVQPTTGTITVAYTKLLGLADADVATGVPEYGERDFTVDDADRYIPGHNALAVGATPIAIDTDTAGCHLLTANAGSCDLSVIDLLQVVAKGDAPIVSELPLTTASGAPLLARPAALAATDLASPIGAACPATPVGIHYVAYPDCHAVAAIDAATGRAVASIRFAADGTATVGDGELSCPRECGDRDPIVDGARPTSLDIVRDERVGTQKLAIGVANRPVVTVVTLAATGLPATVSQVDLDGDVGVTDVALSAQITMGGNGGLNDGDSGTDAQFVYAVASDGTVRVAEVLVANRECDTQVDPRYLLTENDSDAFICMAVGDPATPPRRAGARSPGVEFAGPARPVAVAIGAANNTSITERPERLAGHFAYVSLSNGFTVVVNIDDDNIDDTRVASDPLATQLPLVLPHQIRDSGFARNADNLFEEDMVQRRDCAALSPSPPSDVPSSALVIGGPHADANPVRIFSGASLASEKSYALPAVHQSLCVGTDASVPVPDTNFSAPLDVRLATYPDWHALGFEEDWQFVWEGLLSNDRTDGSQALDGPQVRTGLVDIGGGGISVVDPSAPFCAAGVEPRDIVTLRGCDPARGDAQCGLGETCFVHPDATIATGACLPKDKLDTLPGLCRDYLVSLRRYAVVDALAGRLTLRERKRELRTTPVTGCTSNQQCQDLALYDAQLVSPDHPVDDDTAAPNRTYACEPDTFRTPALNRCVMTCQSDDQCDAGTLCRAGHCIEGIVPAAECASGLQRYDLRAADAFVAIGSRSGYLHPFIADSAGRCVKDPAASPLLVGRVPLTAPPCTGTGPTDLTPNPCSETIDQVEKQPDYKPGTCELTTAGTKLVTRTTRGIRFQNPLLRLTFVDPTYPGDAMCRDDRAGGLVDVPTVHRDASIQFRIVDGFLPRTMGDAIAQPTNVVRAPDGAIWVVDGGDTQPTNNSSTNVRGQLVRVSPRAPDGAVHLQ